ncbi:hypothetical protein FB451DRAFT_1189761 [Mycena latifolia]|nr:hypothetical protein FB451DRAFT_1189761 [Mycena latifolia]
MKTGPLQDQKGSPGRGNGQNFWRCQLILRTNRVAGHALILQRNPRWAIEAQNKRAWVLWEPHAEQKGNGRVGPTRMESFPRGLARNVTWYFELPVKYSRSAVCKRMDFVQEKKNRGDNVRVAHQFPEPGKSRDFVQLEIHETPKPRIGIGQPPCKMQVANFSEKQSSPRLSNFGVQIIEISRTEVAPPSRKSNHLETQKLRTYSEEVELRIIEAFRGNKWKYTAKIPGRDRESASQGEADSEAHL